GVRVYYRGNKGIGLCVFSFLQYATEQMFRDKDVLWLSNTNNWHRIKHVRVGGQLAIRGRVQRDRVKFCGVFRVRALQKDLFRLTADSPDWTYLFRRICQH
ncbi:hypothetical protein KUCAC02_036244, partial [Chaenocephalus aceratus]